MTAGAVRPQPGPKPSGAAPDAVLHTYDGEIQAATFCLTGDGERSPALEAGEFDTGFLEGLGALTPQTPPEAVDWTQTGVELTITDDGEDYVYRVLLDGGLCTEQNGQTYWAGNGSAGALVPAGSVRVYCGGRVPGGAH